MSAATHGWSINGPDPTYQPMDEYDDRHDDYDAPVVLPLPGLDMTRLDGPLPEPRWLVENRIVRQSLTVLGAKPGVGKSWLSMDLAVALAAGRPWVGIDIPQPMRVLYVDAENGDDIALERIQQLGGTSTSLGGRLHYVTASIQLPAASGVARLRATIEWHQPDLVIVDTLASVAPLAEKDTENSSLFLAGVWHLARDHGAAMLLLHHLRKSLQGAPRDDPKDAFRGAGHLIGTASRAWVLDPLHPKEPKFLWHDAKARRGKAQPATRVEVVDYEDDDGNKRTRLETQGTVAGVEGGYDAYLAAVLAYIDARPLREARTVDLLAVEDAPAERTAKDYLNRATASGVLHKPRRGVYRRAEPEALMDPPRSGSLHEPNDPEDDD
ncbi:AAA domain-containing protein [Motilibacter peucedani]|uniref:AAA domain-containing protein n=1 Tax=Motilibacter peucedani TaxID=598650 RepID=A0A420XRU2_9ACTN|nr:AAA family ATPase [Motilibacter peucedani]RKS77584.1 AAA domain-containing protein [Motilibacter peucedani]